MHDFEEKKRIMIVDKYEKVGYLGKGNFGQVFSARHIDSGQQVAIKVIDKRRFKNDDQREHSKNEQKICEMFATILNHPNIVGMFDVLERGDYLYFIMENIEGGELFDKIRHRGQVTEQQAKIWFRELILAIAYIHKHGIIHRDLKPENILLDKNGSIHVCDFGFGKAIEDVRKLQEVYCGSPFYAAPEMVTGIPYHGPPVDMWSCGVILYAMLTSDLPFHSHDLRGLFEKIKRGVYPEVPHLSSQARHLIKSLLCVNPKKRLSAEAALKHPWFHEKRPPFKKAFFTIFNNSNKKQQQIPPPPLPPMYSNSSFITPVPSVTIEELSGYTTKTKKPTKKARSLFSTERIKKFFTNNRRIPAF